MNVMYVNFAPVQRSSKWFLCISQFMINSRIFRNYSITIGWRLENTRYNICLVVYMDTRLDSTHLVSLYCLIRRKVLNPNETPEQKLSHSEH